MNQPLPLEAIRSLRQIDGPLASVAGPLRGNSSPRRASARTGSVDVARTRLHPPAQCAGASARQTSLRMFTFAFTSHVG